CIRCGACLNVCPVYREIGGHAYGSPYSGPIGAVIMPLLADEIADAKELPHASTLCGACRAACPVQIDLPRLLLDLRGDLADKGVPPLAERFGIEGFVRTMSNRRLYEVAGKAASLGSNALARLQGGAISTLPPPFDGWTQSRDFPPFAARSFRELWRERQVSRLAG
ncbi:MAG: 4Fe-4S dicluster domain-containing protein, partial [Ardenticatenaceae bacterium]